MTTTTTTTTTTTNPIPPKNIIFLHPDLGIGGAERLIVDAAVGLQAAGHHITILTSHCSPAHCFRECADGTLDVRVRGHTLLPASVLGGRFTILLAIARQLHLLLGASVAEMAALRPDVFFVDQLSAGLPLLRWLHPRARILFYCHFPDLLLARGRDRWWKRAYRLPFDFLEGWSMGFADRVVVNSEFTKGVVGQVWPELVRTKGLEVVHPCVDVGEEKKELDTNADESLVWRGIDVILSINRFEAKKDVGLAIKAYAGLGEHRRKGVKLVVAGGYDNRVQENVSYHKELTQLADSLGLKSMTAKNVVTALGVSDDIDVLFLLSVPNSLKDALLKSARLLVYTPSNEHFGIVPLEAMLAGTPVLAANTGGPLETVVDGVTGWLRSPDDVEAWTGVMEKVLDKMPDVELQKMAEAGRRRVINEFSDIKMANRLEAIIDNMSSVPRQSSGGLSLVLALSTLPLLGLLSIVSLWRLLYGS